MTLRIPANLHTTTITITTISLDWGDVAGADTYEIYRDGVLVHTNHLPNFLAPRAIDTQFTDTNLWPHSTHTYYVIAANSAQNTKSAGTPVITASTLADTTAPSTPTGVTAVFHRIKQEVLISWNAATDNFIVDHYEILRDLELISSVPGLSFTDTDPPLNDTVSYLIRAVDPTGNTSSGGGDTVITDIDPPTVPSNLAVTASTRTSVSLGWTASEDNFSTLSNCVYAIFRNGNKLAEQPAGNGSTFFDSTAMPATTYQYKVRCRDEAGNISDFSNIVTVKTPN